METENLVPRLLLVGGLTAVLVVYTSRRRKSAQKISVASPAAALSSAAESGAAEASTLVERGQSMLESILDQVAEQALKELKSVLKDGLKRLDDAVEKL